MVEAVAGERPRLFVRTRNEFYVFTESHKRCYTFFKRDEGGAANAEKEAAYAEKEALLRTLSIFRLHVAGHALEQIAQELSLSVEEVERELGAFASGIL